MELDEDLFYLIGALRDGSVFYDKAARTYQLVWYSNSSEYLKNSINERILKVFNKTPKIYEYKNHQFRVRITSKDAYNLVKNTFKFPKDGVGQIAWGTSEILLNAEKKLKHAYIRAMFDAEGDVSLGNRYIEVSQKNTEILEWIMKEFKMLNIKTGKIVIADKKSMTYKFVIAGKSDVANFQNEINFENEMKKNQLQILVGKYKINA